MNKQTNKRTVQKQKTKHNTVRSVIVDEHSLASAIRQHLEIKKYQYAQTTYDISKRKAEQLIKWIGDKPLTSYRASDIELLVVKFCNKKYKGNTINQYLDILRQVFARAVSDGVIHISPMDGIKKCKFEVDEPDPFYQYEIKAFLALKSTHLLEVSLIQLGISTGLRISELMAVSAEAVNLDRKTLLVDLALVDGQYKTPKTRGSIRTIELSEQAVGSLKTLMRLAEHRKAKKITVTRSDNRTQMSEQRTLLAYYSAKRRSYASVDEFRERFFRPFCQAAGVRYRGPSQFRHTYASQLLSAGISIEWIARQMGHTGTEMVVRHYGKWLMEDAPDYRGGLTRYLMPVWLVSRLKLLCRAVIKKLKIKTQKANSMSTHYWQLLLSCRD
ncbi:tyrosine-type recombinase/integrase [Aeromonas caviae]|uniref:tyrosine-type recombinase/integrase n=1 Tax=Aeromonas caviae TaxID=648 RepID=UPI003989DC7C